MNRFALHQNGQSLVEVVLILALVVTLWGLGANSPVEQLLQALRQLLSAYSQGVSRP